MKYKVGLKEDIGYIPRGAMILNAKIVIQGEDGDVMMYLPKKVKYLFKDEIGYEKSDTGSLSFAQKSPYHDYYTRSCIDWINTVIKKFEPGSRREA
jgi:hypothetical protein